MTINNFHTYATNRAANSASNSGSASSADSSNGVNPDDFMSLLVSEIQNQDPTNPESNTEFVSQLATFSSLEQLTSINKGVTSMAQFLSTTSAAVAGATPSNHTADTTPSA